MLTETSLSTATNPPIVFPWRRERLAEAMTSAIARGAPRSTIREAVDELVLHLRRQGIPDARGVAIVMEVASRAVWTIPGEVHAFEAPVDLLALVAAWANARYACAD